MPLENEWRARAGMYCSLRPLKPPPSTGFVTLAVSLLLGVALFHGRFVQTAFGDANATPNRTLPSFSSPNPANELPAHPSVQEIQEYRILPQPLVPTIPHPSVGENSELATALRQYADKTSRDDFSALEQFTVAHPDSPWTPSLLFDLGLEYYKTGWYSKALAVWERAWPMLKDAKARNVKAVADNTAGELALMYARVGRMKELAELLDSIKDRVLPGSAKGKIASAQEGLWAMQNSPQISFRCGPLAVDRISAFTNPRKHSMLRLENSGSTTNGFSLTQVARLSKEASLNYQMAFRNKGAEIMMPAVVHWKVGHYAAVLKETNGLYFLQDLTFRNDAWVTTRALDNETTGYFLVPPGNLPKGWRPVSDAEGNTVWGKGVTEMSEPNAVTPSDCKSCQAAAAAAGMATCSVFMLDVSVNIEDSPVGYTPPVGPPVRLTVNYNQLETDQPATFNYANLGPQWTFNYLAYITDNPSNQYEGVNYFTDGGGTLPFAGFDESSQTYLSQIKSHVLLTRTSTTSYRMLYPDGSSYIFALPDSVSSLTRNVFLTAIVDAHGNSNQISYDHLFRVSAVTDAIGQVTTFSYGDTNDDLKITQVTDPFGRFASFSYDSQGRLEQITDCIGLTSRFTYDSGDNILAMTTPYGTTSFAFGVSTDGTGRGTWEETTYPDGEKDRVAFSEATDIGTDSQDPASTVPQGMWARNWVIYGRDSYFWDRNAYSAYLANTNDYSSAFNYHWLHDAGLGTAMGVTESVKPALENRIWYNYPGQIPGNAGATVEGTSSQPSVIGRVLDDATTQLKLFGYNDLGNVTNSVDPEGRSMTYVYDPNEVDLLEVLQTTGTNNDLLVRTIYNSQHLPVAVFDAAGQMTTNTYNARGQLLTTTDPLNETNRLTYDSNGYLLTIIGPLGPATDTFSFSYDPVGRVHTITNHCHPVKTC